MDFKSAGKKIRQAHRMKHIIQTSPGKVVGISAAFVGHIERGTRVPSVSTLYSICKRLDISMDYVVGLKK